MEFFFFGHELLESAELFVDMACFLNPNLTRQVTLDFRQLVGVNDVVEVIDQLFQVELSGQKSLLKVSDIFLLRVQRREFGSTFVDGNFLK